MGDLRELRPVRPPSDLTPEQEGEAQRITETVMLCVRPAMSRAGLSYDQADIVAEGVLKGARAAVRFERAARDGS